MYSYSLQLSDSGYQITVFTTLDSGKLYPIMQQDFTTKEAAEEYFINRFKNN